MADSKTSSIENADDMLTLLEGHDRLADELLALTERQHALIDAGETDELLGVIARRQELLQGLLSTEGLLEDRDWTERFADAPEARRASARALLMRIEGKLAEIMRTDERDQALLRERMGENRREVSAQDAARGARHAYGRANGGGSNAMGSAPPRFTDRKG